MTGRPSEFNQETADAICERLADGESLRTICGPARDVSLPGQTTIFKWLAENEAFAKQYAHARQLQADSKFDMAWEIAESATAETVQVARLQYDALKWQTGKLAPKKYGDKLDVEHGGEVGIVVNVKRYGAAPSGD